MRRRLLRPRRGHLLTEGRGSGALKVRAREKRSPVVASRVRVHGNGNDKARHQPPKAQGQGMNSDVHGAGPGQKIATVENGRKSE